MDCRDTPIVAQALCEELREHDSIACAWIGKKNSSGDFLTLAIAGDGAVERDFTKHPHGRLDDRCVAPVLHTIMAAHPVLMNTTDESLAAWHSDLTHDGIQAVLGVPVLLPDRQVAVVLVFTQSESLFEQGESPAAKALGEDIAWLFDRQFSSHRQALLEQACLSAGNSMFLTDSEGDIVWANPAFTGLTGYESREVLGRNPRFLQSGRQGRRYYRSLWKTVSSGQVWTSETTDKDKHGYLYTINQTISPLKHQGRISHYLSVHEDVSRKRVIQVERERAHPVDQRTGLLNASAFHDALARVSREDLGDSGRVYVVSLVLVSFHSAIDVLGAETEKYVLERIGECVRSALDLCDIGGYFGHGEFGLILQSPIDRDSAIELVQKVIAALRKPMPLLGENMQFGPQFGLAEFPENAATAENVWRMADDLMTAEST